ncbi:parathyroid hormone/parathyroid hormone-related peptide receptor [Plakobranchus ocellatus]|uniref:Parathyroid hormone/parathyroid hormone-related peptide receptor n=1 Tax=Plakobranchus ocellatus TaxID=259542 RepID=A0AAV4CH10_9GAST|nr:parathyroid hormone/parathyroid hormone-related peptide receptor [Plakobranchus ocellatus]
MLQDFQEVIAVEVFIFKRNILLLQMTDKQMAVLLEQRDRCWTKMDRYYRELGNSTDPPRCPVVWDDIMCWDAAPPGTQQAQRCPEYIQKMNHSAFAYRYCEADGSWYYHKEYNKSWTNYLECLLNNTSFSHDVAHGDRLGLILTVGYGVSLLSLVIAVLIMYFSRLKSKSNTLHVNLFLAFILRAVLSFLKQFLFVQHLGLEKDVTRTDTGKLKFDEEGSHWECRLLYTVFMYSVCVSQMWIFVEGLYLHMLIYRTLSTERNGVRPYIFLGWVLPFAILVPWLIVKLTADNVVCWNVSKKSGYIWVIHGPLLASVLINFVFFLNISRVLCSRVRSSQRHAGNANYRQLAKFILVLIPLFGVVYIVLTVVFPTTYTNRFDIWPMYVEQTYSAFQGFILALLFCFLNEEVHNEIKRIWWRRRTRRRDSALTRSFVLSSFRRGNSYTPRGTSGKAIHPVKKPSCRNKPAEKQQPSWPVRLKRRVLLLLGRSHTKRDSIVKRSKDIPPFVVEDNGHTGLSRIEQEEMEMRMKLTGPNHHQQEVEDISSG